MAVNLLQRLVDYFILLPDDLDIEGRRVHNFKFLLRGVFLFSGSIIALRVISRFFGIGDFSLHALWPPALMGTIALFLLVLLKKWPRQRTIAISFGAVFVLTLILVAVRGGPLSLYGGMIPVLVFVSGLFFSPGGILTVALFALASFSFLVTAQNAGLIPPTSIYAEETLFLPLLVGNALILCTGIMVSLFAYALLHRRSQMENAVRSYQNLVDVAPDPIIVWDNDGHITRVNEAFLRTLGYESEKDLANKTAADIVPPGKAGEASRLLRESLHSIKPLITDFELLKSNGAGIPVELHITPIREGDRPAGLNGICRDTSERVRAEQERQALREKLIMQDKMASLGGLVLGIAHEYNNILAGLRGYAQLAQIPGKENRMKELPQVVTDLVDRAQKVTEGLLAFSERFEPDSNRVNLMELLEGMVKLMRKDFERSGIRLDLRIPNDAEIVTDVARFQQVLLNLISNAREAMPDGGTLRISYEHRGNKHQIEVKDEGEGIPPQDLPRIFDPFYTTKGPMASGEGRSIGLGLSICYSVVKGLGGEIEVDCGSGKGSTFRVLLPDEETAPE